MKAVQPLIINDTVYRPDFSDILTIYEKEREQNRAQRRKTNIRIKSAQKLLDECQYALEIYNKAYPFFSYQQRVVFYQMLKSFYTNILIDADFTIFRNSLNPNRPSTTNFSENENKMTIIFTDRISKILNEMQKTELGKVRNSEFTAP